MDLQTILLLIAAILIGTAIGFFGGRFAVRKGLRAAVLRNRPGDASSEVALVIQPNADDGVMEMLIGKRALKRLRLGQSLSATVTGQRASMVFRVRQA